MTALSSCRHSVIQGYPVRQAPSWDFERHLRTHGCFLNHHGGSHDVWVNPANGAQAPIPRHTTLKRGTVEETTGL